MNDRRRVVISAYACGPVDEPEARAGWEFAVAAARDHDVCVITRERFRAVIDEQLRRQPDLRARLHVVHLDLHPRLLRWKTHLPAGVYWYYVLWQRELGRTVARLHRRHPFDVGHHVTFANDWLPCGLAAVRGLPLVWGPVGGASRTPYWRLRRWLGIRGVVTELVRDAATALPRRWWGDRAARSAAVVVAQNDAVARRFAFARRVVVEPNAVLESFDLPRDGGTPSGVRTAVFAGRLLAWKGARLALAAIARCSDDWRLVVFGSGYERERLEILARRAGIAERVDFRGHRPRAEVLAAIAAADVFLFPSMHDQAGWVAAEASSLGCPVVCLPLGGPPLLAAPNAFVADLRGDLAANVAAEVARAAAAGGRAHDRWSARRLPALTDAWYRAAADSPVGASA
ncbi:glycosyltransferase [Tersicoccus sp. MR15.9]|uniref:glycosyltransferase n=1 Tax=Tersicoccus mangrovi TaxID=3121635 RepID=UPI002FE6145B